MGKPRDTKIAILPSTTRKGTTLSTSAALDSPSVIDKLVSPPHASHAGTSAESENSHNIDNVSAVLDDSGSLGSFLDATIAKSRQIENTETPNATTPVKSPELDYSSDDLDEDYVELDDDFIEKCNATTDARKIKKLLAEHAVRYKPSPDPKFATSPINIRDKDYDFSLDLSHIAIVEKTPFCGTEKESAVEHMIELSTLSGVFSDDVKMRTYFVAKIFPFSLKDDAKTWYNNLPPGSIKSPTDLRDVFFRKYFPASAQHAALQRIYNFDQEDGEKLPEAWARFCSLIRAQPDHDLEKHDLLDIFYSGLTIESRAYLDSCAGCVFRKRTPDDAEELLAKIGRNHDDWSTPEPTPTPIVKKRGMIKLNDEDMREAKKSLKEKGIKPEDVKNLPPIEDICETIPPSSMIEYMKDIVTNKRKIPNEEISTMLANYSFNGKIPKKLGDPDKLIPTDISLQMADKSTAIPVGLCENVPVQVTQHCLILTDFVVLEMPEDDNMSIILGRPFLNTAGAVIDCNKGMVTFNVDDKEHTVYFPKRIDKMELAEPLNTKFYQLGNGGDLIFEHDLNALSDFLGRPHPEFHGIQMNDQVGGELQWIITADLRGKLEPPTSERILFSIRESNWLDGLARGLQEALARLCGQNVVRLLASRFAHLVRRDAMGVPMALQSHPQLRHHAEHLDYMLYHTQKELDNFRAYANRTHLALVTHGDAIKQLSKDRNKLRLKCAKKDVTITRLRAQIASLESTVKAQEDQLREMEEDEAGADLREETPS
ncbi:hypothetical protein QYE76_039994 [Lolium multiflorum]|uniref:Retrotransposon gag domain-containing protein n=1 Tax=Lolium multiflorum TaxID=4521 RepID=A0AAD8TAX4_LOLMU|nr:hypothetical protein QYE76_039994 [Lolium multiflorum]